MKNINPQKYNLSSKVKLQENAQKKIFLIFKRKSRVIMKDGIKTLEIVKKIKQVDKNKHIGILSYAPVCSKTKSFLESQNISVDTI